MDAQPIQRFEAWRPNNGDQRTLWPGYLELSNEFYETLRHHAVPLDYRALSALKHSALPLDVPFELAHRLCRVTNSKGTMLSWQNLRDQFGQEYANPEDFKKEFRAVLRQVWLVSPTARIGEDKRPFMTWEDIERRVGRGGLAAYETKRLWDSLFLDLRQIDGFLGFVKAHASRPWVYPRCVAAAHTGARRSELARLHIDDIDFQDKTVLVHKRKRVKGQLTARRVPLTPVVEQVLFHWIRKDHPGGSALFCHKENAGHRPSDGETTIPITVDDAGWHFTQTVRGSKWAVLRGWHVLRHSFASNLAAKGVDQRFIDEFLGHQTEAQRRRYRHLFPHQQRQVLCQVFGG